MFVLPPPPSSSLALELPFVFVFLWVLSGLSFSFRNFSSSLLTSTVSVFSRPSSLFSFFSVFVSLFIPFLFFFSFCRDSPVYRELSLDDIKRGERRGGAMAFIEGEELDVIALREEKFVKPVRRRKATYLVVEETKKKKSFFSPDLLASTCCCSVKETGDNNKESCVGLRWRLTRRERGVYR